MQETLGAPFWTGFGCVAALLTAIAAFVKIWRRDDVMVDRITRKVTEQVTANLSAIISEQVARQVNGTPENLDRAINEMVNCIALVAAPKDDVPHPKMDAYRDEQIQDSLDRMRQIPRSGRGHGHYAVRRV